MIMIVTCDIFQINFVSTQHFNFGNIGDERLIVQIYIRVWYSYQPIQPLA